MLVFWGCGACRWRQGLRERLARLCTVLASTRARRGGAGTSSKIRVDRQSKLRFFIVEPRATMRGQQSPAPRVQTRSHSLGHAVNLNEMDRGRAHTEHGAPAQWLSIASGRSRRAASCPIDGQRVFGFARAIALCRVFSLGFPRIARFAGTLQADGTAVETAFVLALKLLATSSPKGRNKD